MKLLEQTAKAAEAEPGREDVVVLHINHCMDNTFYFNDVLKSLFAHVTLLTPPPHPLTDELRKNTWEKDYGEDY